MKRKQYPGDLTDKEWGVIRGIIEKKHSPRGRKPKYTKREMLNAVFYLMRSGCSWRLLPHDFPPWQAVYSQFVRWKKERVFEKLNEHIRGVLRLKLGRDLKASAGIIDSQSVKTTEKGGSVDMTEEKKLKDAKDISQSTRKGFYYRDMLRVRPRATRKGAKGS